MKSQQAEKRSAADYNERREWSQLLRSATRSCQFEVSRSNDIRRTGGCRPTRRKQNTPELEIEKTRSAPFPRRCGPAYIREGQSVTKGDRLFWSLGGTAAVALTVPKNILAAETRPILRSSRLSPGPIQRALIDQPSWIPASERRSDGNDPPAPQARAGMTVSRESRIG